MHIKEIKMSEHKRTLTIPGRGYAGVLRPGHLYPPLIKIYRRAQLALCLVIACRVRVIAFMNKNRAEHGYTGVCPAPPTS